MKTSFYNIFIYFIIISTILIACNKDDKDIEVNLAYQLIADKTWYLDYSQNISGSTVTNRTYLGQPTYFINYLKNLATSDSDGLIGIYEIIKTDSSLVISVQAKTISGNPSTYNYEIESIGQKNMIMNYNKNNTKTRLFFSTQK
jgi:hypothetical protein